MENWIKTENVMIEQERTAISLSESAVRDLEAALHVAANVLEGYAHHFESEKLAALGVVDRFSKLLATRKEEN